MIAWLTHDSIVFLPGVPDGTDGVGAGTAAFGAAGFAAEAGNSALLCMIFSISFSTSSARTSPVRGGGGFRL
ncbi:hypothetical protein GBF35_45455 [Nonomuraea phyllanthi]|nr:hypothetical protein GBF35_45455 [Nonomuraea phyllanthi]